MTGACEVFMVVYIFGGDHVPFPTKHFECHRTHEACNARIKEIKREEDATGKAFDWRSSTCAPVGLWNRGDDE